MKALFQPGPSGPGPVPPAKRSLVEILHDRGADAGIGGWFGRLVAFFAAASVLGPPLASLAGDEAALPEEPPMTAAMIEKESARARLEVTAVQKDIETAKRAVTEAEKALPRVEAATQQISERIKNAAADLKIIKRPAEAATAPELVPDKAKPPAPAGKAVIDEFDNASAWRNETWADDAAISGDGERLTVDLQPGTAGKCAISRSLSPATQFGTDETLLVEVENKAGAVALTVAVTLNAYYESTARQLKAGMNRIAFRMSDKNFKTKTTAWKHTASLPAKRRIKNLTLMLYTRKAGQVTFDRLTVETAEP